MANEVNCLSSFLSIEFIKVFASVNTSEGRDLAPKRSYIFDTIGTSSPVFSPNLMYVYKKAYGVSFYMGTADLGAEETAGLDDCYED